MGGWTGPNCFPLPIIHFLDLAPTTTTSSYTSGQPWCPCPSLVTWTKIFLNFPGIAIGPGTVTDPNKLHPRVWSKQTSSQIKTQVERSTSSFWNGLTGTMVLGKNHSSFFVILRKEPAWKLKEISFEPLHSASHAWSMNPYKTYQLNDPCLLYNLHTGHSQFQGSWKTQENTGLEKGNFIYTNYNCFYYYYEIGDDTWEKQTWSMSFKQSAIIHMPNSI